MSSCVIIGVLLLSEVFYGDAVSAGRYSSDEGVRCFWNGCIPTCGPLMSKVFILFIQYSEHSKIIYDYFNGVFNF